jgi:hypothetical protein
MRLASWTTLALLCVGALLIGACSDDGTAEKGDRDRADAEADTGPPEPPDAIPTIGGPVLDIIEYRQVDRCSWEGPSDHYPTTTRDPSTCGPQDDDSVGQIIVADPEGDSRMNGVFIYVKRDTEVLVADEAGGWRRGSFDDLSFGGEVQVWNRRGKPLEHTSADGFPAGTITYRPLTGPPPPPTSPPPWNPGVAGTVAWATACPSPDPALAGSCVEGALGIALLDETRVGPNGEGEDQLVAITADTVVLVDHGPAWRPGALADVSAGSPVRAWFGRDKTPDPDETSPWVLVIGPTTEW